MKLNEYLKLRAEESVSTTRAVNELATMFGIDARTPWRWHQAGKVPWYIEKLLQIWAESTTEQRKKWFNS